MTHSASNLTAACSRRIAAAQALQRGAPGCVHRRAAAPPARSVLAALCFLHMTKPAEAGVQFTSTCGPNLGFRVTSHNDPAGAVKTAVRLDWQR